MTSGRDPLLEHARRRIREQLFGPAASGDDDIETPTIGRFELIDKLGEGGMGVVYSARDPSLGRNIAIKLLNPSRDVGSEGRQRLLREAHALARLSHPNVVVVHEVGVHEGQVYLVMELVDGTTLGRWCHARHGDWRAIVDKYCDAGRALAAAHDAGLVHRDFKPDNVLVASDDRVRVLDFGLAATATDEHAGWEALLEGTTTEDDLTLTGTILGTPAYMAPEQFDGGEVDARADQFAFCVALWEALFGQRPYVGHDLHSLRRALIEGELREPPDLRGVPQPIVASLRRGLSVEPERRFESMRPLLAELEAQASASATRRRARFLGPSVLGLVAVVSTAAAWIAWQDPQPDSVADAASSGSEHVGTTTPSQDTIMGPVAAEIPLRRLTHTGGRGVEYADVDLRGDRLLYHHDGWWVRPIEGGVPNRLELPSGATQVRLGRQSSHWIFHEGRLLRVDAQNRTEEVAAGLPSAVDEWGIDEKHQSFWSYAGSTLSVVTFGRPDSSTIPLPEADAHSVARGPEPNRWAVVSSHYDSPSALSVIDERGEILASVRVSNRFGSVGWLANGAIVTLEEDDEMVWLRCFRFDGSELHAGPRSASMAPRSNFHRILGTHEGQVLVRLYEANEDVFVFDAPAAHGRGTSPDDSAHSAEWVGRSLSSDWDGGDRDPVWLSDQDLAIVTQRFLRPTLIRIEDEVSEVKSITEEPVAWAEGDGAGGLVYATKTDPVAVRWLPRGETSARELPEVAARSGSRRSSLDCIRPDDCLMAFDAGDGLEFFAVDLTTGDVRRRFPCPTGWSHVGRRRWSYTQDGSRLLMIDARQHRLGEFDAGTGALLRLHPEPDASLIIQSVREARDGYWLTGMTVGDADSTPYKLMHYRPGEELRIVWHNESSWIFGAEPSPDGSRLATDALTLHGEAWLADASSLCNPG